MTGNHLKWYHHTLHQYLRPEEIKSLMEKKDWRAWGEILHTWLWIAFAFALVGFFPHPITIVVSLFILGGKQLACAIILHDCSHESLFTSRRLNHLVGSWLGAYPILNDLEKYKPYHVQHHIHTGMDDDPDLPLTQGYPTTSGSMLRKFIRDFFGLSGLKSNFGLVMMQLGLMKYALNGKAEWVSWRGMSWSDMVTKGFRNLAGPLLSNLILFLILYALGNPWLYLLWIGALLTTYNFCIRVRSIAEHSMVLDNTNPHQNTRTTYANFLERMLFAPHHVNYHSEHHLCMGIPSYNLPRMHKMLLERGYYKDGTLASDYSSIVKLAMAKN